MPFVPGHFGEWLQGRLGPEGPIVLVTLRCPALGVSVERIVLGALVLDQEPPVLDEVDAKRLLEILGLDAEGTFGLRTPLPPGGGAGVSTASLVALARAAGWQGNDAALARACLAVEGATDPLMLERPDEVLWSPRTAAALEPFATLPPCEIVGGFLGSPQRTDPFDTAFPDISDLVTLWRNARGLTERARIASRSAERTTAHRGPSDDPMPGLARALGALGHARAHTGSARALIFAPETLPECAEATLTAAGLTGVVRFVSGP